MRHGKLQIAVVFAIAIALSCGVSHAATETVSHDVTVTTPGALAFTADTSNFTLTFSGFTSGSETDTKVVTYTVSSNNVTGGGITGSLDSAYTDVDLKADPGTYSTTTGTRSLIENASGFITIGTSSTQLALMNGTGSILSGTMPITYKATATDDLSATSQTKTLTLTLADA